MSNSDTAISTTISALSDKFGVRASRVRDAAVNLSSVAVSNGAVECSKSALTDLRRRIEAQTA